MTGDFQLTMIVVTAFLAVFALIFAGGQIYLAALN